MTDKEIISKIYKQIKHFNKKIKQANQKMDGRPKQTFTKRRHTDVQNHMKRFSTSLVTREMQIKMTLAISSHTSQNGYHQKIYKQLMLETV